MLAPFSPTPRGEIINKWQPLWHNGELVPPEATRVSLLSHGFSRGSGIFDVFATLPGPEGRQAFRMDAHLERLLDSARLLEMNLPHTAEEMAQACARVAEANRMGRGLIKMFGYWAGEKAVALVPDDPLDLSIFCIEGGAELALDDYTPLTACISKWRKLDNHTVPTAAKACANYMNGYLARRDAVNRGRDLGIMLDKHGNLAEGSIEAVLVVKDGVLRAPPPDNVLASISRDTVLKLAEHAGIPVQVAPISRAELLGADELFAAHSLSRTMPIRQLEDREFAAPGPVTEHLHDLMTDLFAFRMPAFSHWFQPL